MNDMVGPTMIKSDQLNSEDLIYGPRTIHIRDTNVLNQTQQPVSIFFDGDDGKPWKPCKTSCKILRHLWGSDSKKYIGRSLTLYRDEDVKFGGAKVGGIRISHMEGLTGEVTLLLSESKMSRKPSIIKPLHISLGPDRRPLEAAATEAANKGTDAFRAWYKDVCSAEERAYLKPSIGVYQDIATKADAAKTEGGE